MAKITPMRAIRKKCLDCSGDQSKEVRLCPIPECSLYPYRMGRRPVVTETNSPAKNSKIAKEKTVEQQERILSGAGR